MRKRIDFSRESRPFCYYQRVAFLHSIESVLFRIDSEFNFLLRAVNEKHNERAAYCPAAKTFLPGAIDVPNNRITLVGSWPVGKAIVFTSTGAVPAPLVAGQVYYVQSIPLAGTVRLAATYGGVALILAGVGAGVHTIHAALAPDVGYRIGRVSSGLDEHYSPLMSQLFASPGPIGAGVFLETGTYTAVPGSFGINFTATPRKLARPYDSLFYGGETIHIRITGQTINSPTIAEDNLPSYADIFLVGRHYPDNALPEWARRRGR